MWDHWGLLARRDKFSYVAAVNTLKHLSTCFYWHMIATPRMFIQSVSLEVKIIFIID